MTREEEWQRLCLAARELNLPLARPEGEKLLEILDALEAGNAQFNLTAIRDRPEMLTKHLLDSLSVMPFLKGSRLADVGTGAGFPGLPLAAVNPARHFTLIEATGKKARYAADTAERVGLANVEVVHSRAEHYRPAQLFDTVMARALSSIADFVAYAGHLCAPHGRLLAMKGKRPDQEIPKVPKSFRVVAVHRLEVSGLDAERHLVELSPVPGPAGASQSLKARGRRAGAASSKS
jgi:16S rRNA (guanine527-N7)-methyltransferase